MLVSTSAFAIEWGNGDGQVANLAKGAEVTVSTLRAGEDPQSITDEADNTGWQAFEFFHKFCPNDWVLIDLGKEMTFTDMQIMWQASHCKEYSVYVLANQPQITDIPAVEGEDAHAAYKTVDVEGLTVAATRTDNTENDYTDNFSFNNAQTGRYILIYANEYNGWGTNYGMKIFEVRVGNANPVATSIKVSASDNKLVEGTPVTLTAKVLDQNGAEMNGSATLSFTNTDDAKLEGNTFTANKIGDYTITATCENIADYTAEYVVSVVTKAEYKFVEGKEPLTHTVKVNGIAATDFNSFNGQAKAFTESTFPFTIEYEFEDAQNFSLLNIRWEAACPSDYDLTVTYADNTTSETKVVTNRAFANGVNPADKIANSDMSLKNVKKLTLKVNGREGHNYNIQLLGIDAYGEKVLSEVTQNTYYFDFVAADYGTIMLPFNAAIPEGMEIYSVNGSLESNENYTILDMQKVTDKIAAYTPYIMHFTKENVENVDEKKFNFTGSVKVGDDDNVYNAGWLNGVMKNGYVPVGSYALLNQNNKIGFYKVATNDININANHAYLTPKTSDVVAFVFDMDDATAIENIATSEALVNVYDLNGVVVRKNVKACEALQNLKKGIYVVNGAKKAVK